MPHDNRWEAGEGRRVILVGGEDARLRIPYALELQRRGFGVTMMGTDDERPFTEHRIDYATYPLNRRLHPLDDLRAARRLGELFRASRPDIVHAFDTKPGIIVPSVALKANAPVRVRTINGMGYVFSSRSPAAFALRPVYRALQRRASRAASHTVFQNADDQAYFLQHGLVDAKRQHLIRGSGIDVDAMQRGRPDPRAREALLAQLGAKGRVVVTMVARLVRHKGVMEFLRAAEQVRRRFPKALFLLVGPRATETSSAVTTGELEAYAESVRYLGFRRDVPELLSVSDICVLPTYYREGVPRVLLEAGALGVPLIATDMPGCRDVVIDGVTGRLVPARNASRLADAIARLISHPQMRLSMGAAGRALVHKDFSLQTVVEQYANIYRQAPSSTMPRAARKAA